MVESSRPTGVLLSFTFGSGANYPSSCPAFFVRSFAALPAPKRTSLHVLYDKAYLAEGELPCENEPAGDGVHYDAVPRETLWKLKRMRVTHQLDQYRLYLFDWFLDQLLRRPGGDEIAYVGTVDTDVLFQLDPFDAMHPFVQQELELFFTAENPVELNGGYTLRELRRNASAVPCRCGGSEAHTICICIHSPVCMYSRLMHELRRSLLCLAQVLALDAACAAVHSEQE